MNAPFIPRETVNANTLTKLQVALGIVNEAAWIASLPGLKQGALENEKTRLQRLWQYHADYPGLSAKICAECDRLIRVIVALQARRLAVIDPGPAPVSRRINRQIDRDLALVETAQPHRRRA